MASPERTALAVRTSAEDDQPRRNSRTLQWLNVTARSGHCSKSESAASSLLTIKWSAIWLAHACSKHLLLAPFAHSRYRPNREAPPESLASNTGTRLLEFPLRPRRRNVQDLAHLFSSLPLHICLAWCRTHRYSAVARSKTKGGVVGRVDRVPFQDGSARRAQARFGSLGVGA
jgi:hypothetical protein